MDNCVNEHFAGEDGRGKNSSANKLPESTRQAVRNHIAKFPAVESHYCRKKTSKRYLAANLNICEMHRLYIEECKTTLEPEASKSFYRNLFVTEYNIGFRKPKKDQCLTCTNYLNIRQREHSLKKRTQTSRSIIKRKLNQEKKRRKTKNKQTKITQFMLQLLTWRQFYQRHAQMSA